MVFPVEREREDRRRQQVRGGDRGRRGARSELSHLHQDDVLTVIYLVMGCVTGECGAGLGQVWWREGGR